MTVIEPPSSSLTPTCITIFLLALPIIYLLAYLINLNRLLSRTPPDFHALHPTRWSPSEIHATHTRLLHSPITTASYASQIPSLPQTQQNRSRRYIITGGAGLVGGYLVLQLLERGTPPHAIRIVDFQRPHRADMLAHPSFADVDFRKTDISSAEETEAAFTAPWGDRDVEKWPLTVFHTAAVIIPSARSELVKSFCEAVNVQGTENVLAATKEAGADVLIATSSASIGIRPIEFWERWPSLNWWWGKEYPRYYAQILDEKDFWQPLRSHGDFFGNYPASKAKAERLICAANGRTLRTGCVRPANGVYGHPTDNIVGAPLNIAIYPVWVEHVVQSFAHGINCALAHLHLEALLVDPASHTAPQAGRPFCITDPSPPICYGDIYTLISELAITPFRLINVPPVPMLLLSYAIEAYNLLPAQFPILAKFLPAIPGNAVYLEPGLFSICTHLVGDMSDAQKPVAEGGLGFQGAVTTLEGMCQELVEWNREQAAYADAGKAPLLANGLAAMKGSGKVGAAKIYRNSVSLAEEIQRLGRVRKS